MLFGTVTMPVELLTVIVPGAVEGETLCTTMVEMLPLSVGPVAGLTVVPLPSLTETLLYVRVGSVLAVAVTVTVSVAVAFWL